MDGHRMSIEKKESPKGRERVTMIAGEMGQPTSNSEIRMEMEMTHRSRERGGGGGVHEQKEVRVMGAGIVVSRVVRSTEGNFSRSVVWL